MIVNAEGDRKRFPFQKRLDIAHGFTRVKIPFEEIAAQIDVTQEIHIVINPNISHAEDDGLVLYFGTLSFVADQNYGEIPLGFKCQNAQSSTSRNKEEDKHVKILVWDLDNTIWESVLIEDGSEGISLKPNIKEIIQELDQRGIVNTIASKNNSDQALGQLKQFGLLDFFVFPKIGWNPKGESIRTLIKEFNVGQIPLLLLMIHYLNGSKFASQFQRSGFIVRRHTKIC